MKVGDGMDAKQFLRQAEKLDAKIRNKMIERQQWRDMALGITANMGGERVQSSSTSKSKMADALDKCVDMEPEIDALIDELIDTKREIIRTIELVDSPTEYNVLHMRYIQYKGFKEIAAHYGKEYNWVTTCHGRALESVQAILDAKVCDCV